MRYFLLLLLCFLLQLQYLSADKGEKIVITAESCIGVKESGNNRGVQVQKFQQSVNASIGSPWCAAFIRYVLDKAGAGLIRVRSALAQDYIVKSSVKAKDVAKGYIKVKPGWLVIWKYADTYRGHIGIVKNWDKNEGNTVEGNTGADGGREGDGVYGKHRKIISYAQLHITHFTPTY